VDALECRPGETILEIGPGEGTLTHELLARGVNVLAIEKDRALAQVLRAPNLTVVPGDALKMDWPRADKIVGNIPYYITSPLLEKAMRPPLPQRIVFLVQLEVAERLAAPPGSKTYGALSIGVQAVCRVEKLFTVAAGAFRPPPKVKSAVVRLTPLQAPMISAEDIAAFRAFVAACFSRRRKQLKNAVPKLMVEDLIGLGLDPTTRPEDLAPAAFVRMFRVASSREDINLD
jgi:16S rRNA (adenine1518-N6/adenine1519-N6)-dimethyltransferase